jgi:hypothetical protein
MLAGMSCIKKQKNKILNEKVFEEMILYMEKLYEYEYNINTNLNKNTTLFSFGFEENTLSNILIPHFIHNKKKNDNGVDITIIPIFFDFGRKFNFYYNDILICLTDEFRKKIYNIM